MNEIDFNELAHKVNRRLTEMGRERDCSLKEMKMRIVQAIMEAVKMPAQPAEPPRVDYAIFSDKGESFESAYRNTVEGTLYDIFAGVAIECLDLIAARDMTICDMDHFMLHTAPKALGTPAFGDNLNEFLYDAVGTIFHIRNNETSMLECIRMWEKNPADKELEKIINEEFGDIEFPEDIELRTSYGYENFIVLRKILVVLSMMAAWFKNRGGKGMVWHINAKLYYMAEAAK